MCLLLRHPNYYYKNLLFFFTQYKNEWKECEVWRQKSQKSGFYRNKKVIKIDGIDVNEILVYKEESYGSKNSFESFIG